MCKFNLSNLTRDILQNTILKYYNFHLIQVSSSDTKYKYYHLKIKNRYWFSVKYKGEQSNNIKMINCR